ncbi:DUF1361 domain-containing protein [Polluticoccus soli]|uniref:DUF1361 domain-containing protein n=1 Tax=Polluticoccus soli TaxID=3034150 RepID=UPI0023E18492|nr:DUF1361 domain-containing protein [Flavipsychrobacter sp. JY13-12]
MRFIERYKWLMPSLCFSGALIIGRVLYTGHLTFAFLTWNLFLAVLPLYFSHKIETASTTRRGWTYAALWLLFFPNAMYIVTDLFHLRERGDVPLWYDLLLILSAALNGVVLGFISLRKMERWLISFISKRYISAVIFVILVACGYGIYLGRYERWNSWDVLANPFSLASNILYHVIHPYRNADIWMLSAAFGTWMYLVYKQLTRIRPR